MYVREKISNHFLNIFENKYLAMIYFRDKDINNFNNRKLNELNYNLKKAEFLYKQINILLSVVYFLDNKFLISKVRLKYDEIFKSLRKCSNELEVFEANLAYLLVVNVLDINVCINLGFDRKYIIELLEYYKKLIKNPYIEYEFDEATGKTLKITESGRRIILPYVPHVVKNTIKEKYSLSYYKRYIR